MESLDAFAGGGVAEVLAFVGNFLLLLVLAVALFFLALRAGRAILVSLILALYAGYALFSAFPYKEQLALGDTPFLNALSGLVLFGLFTLFPYLLLRRVSSSGNLRINPVALAALAFATGGFVLALGYQVLDIASLVPLTPALDALFAPDKYFFWWFVAPLAGVYFTTR